MKYTLLEKFGAFSSIELMNDFDLKQLFLNFSILKSNPLYKDIMEDYHFDDSCKCQELASDIINVKDNGEAIITNVNSLFFQLNPALLQDIMNSAENKQICYSFVRDYKKLLIESYEKSDNKVMSK